MHHEVFTRLIVRISEAKAELQMYPERDHYEEYNEETCSMLSDILWDHAYHAERELLGSMNINPPKGLNFLSPLLISQLYDTYLRVTEKLDSRFELSYLAKIPMAVLIECLPAVRRADYLAQQGKFTSVSVSRDSISIPVLHRSSSKVFAGDLDSWWASDEPVVNAHCPGECHDGVEFTDRERVKLFDDIVTNEPLEPFREDVDVKYDDASHLYYDKMTDNSEISEKYTIIR